MSTKTTSHDFTVVFYVAEKQLTKAHQPVVIKGQVACYVRAEATDKRLGPALDSAKPLHGEILLNSVEIPFIL